MAQKISQQVLEDFTATITKNPNVSRQKILEAFPEFNNDSALLDAAYDYAETRRMNPYEDIQTINSKFPEFFGGAVEQPAQPAEQPKQPSLLQSIGAHNPYPIQPANPLKAETWDIDKQNRERLERIKSATLPMSDEDKQREAEIERLGKEGAFGTPNGISITYDKRTGSPIITRTEGDGARLYTGVNANQPEIDRLINERPDYMRTPHSEEDIVDNIERAWITNTENGQKAIADAEQRIKDFIASCQENFKYTQQAQQIAQALQSGQIDEQQAQQYADSAFNELYGEVIMQHVQEEKDAFTQAALSDNQDYYLKAKRDLQYAATNKVTADAHKQIDNLLKNESEPSVMQLAHSGGQLMRDPYIHAAQNFLYKAEQRMNDMRLDKYEAGDFAKNVAYDLGGILESTATFGLSDLADRSMVTSIFKKVADAAAKAKDPDEIYNNPELVLNDKERAVYTAYTAMISAEMARSLDTSYWADAAKLTADMIPFMLEVGAMNGIFGGINRAAQEGISRGLTRSIVSKLPAGAKKTAAKMFTGAITDIAGAGLYAGESAVMSLALPRTYANMLQKEIDVDYNALKVDNDNLVIGGFDTKSTPEAFMNAWRDQWKEMFTETGGLFNVGANVLFNNPIAKRAFYGIKRSNLGGLIDMFNTGKFFDFAKQVGYHGTYKEWLEEVEGTCWDYAFGDKDAFANFFSRDTQIPMLISFTVPAVLGGGINAGREIKYRMQFKNATNNILNTIKSHGFTDEDFADIKKSLYATPVEDLPATIANMAAALTETEQFGNMYKDYAFYSNKAKYGKLSPEEQQRLDVAAAYLFDSNNAQTEEAKALAAELTKLAYAEVALSAFDKDIANDRRRAYNEAVSFYREQTADIAQEEQAQEQSAPTPYEQIVQDVTRTVNNLAFRNGGELTDDTPVFRVSLNGQEGKQGYIVSGESLPELDATGTIFTNNPLMTIKWDDESVTQHTLNELVLLGVSTAGQRIAQEVEARNDERAVEKIADGEKPVIMTRGNEVLVLFRKGNGILVDEHDQEYVDTQLFQDGWKLTEDQEERHPNDASGVTPMTQGASSSMKPAAPNIDTMSADEYVRAIVEDRYKGNRTKAQAIISAKLNGANTDLQVTQKEFDKFQKKGLTSSMNEEQWEAQYDKYEQQIKGLTALVSKLEAANIAVVHYKTQAELQEEAERKAREAAMREQRRQLAEAEAAGDIEAKWQNTKKTVGFAATKTLPNGQKVNGHYILTEAGDVVPSHDPRKNYADSEGYVMENGQNVNDNNYKDPDVQRIALDIAQNYGGQAVEQMPFLENRAGRVLSGNNRTISGIIAAENNTDQAYLAALAENAQQYGFTPEQLAEYQHPRLQFIVEDELPFTTGTFAMFNQQEKKTKSSVNRAVANSKMITEAVRDRLLEIMDQYESLDSFFGSPIAATSVTQTLINEGLMTQQEVAEKMEDSGIFNQTGKEYVTDMLLGTLFDEKTIRMLAGEKTLKQAILRALPSIVENRRLKGYELTESINEAIKLLYEARNNNKGKNTADAFKLYLRQGSLTEGYTIDRYKPFDIILANRMSAGVEQLREILGKYNNSARDEANGQMGLFEPRTADQIKQDVYEYYTKQQPELAAALNGEAEEGAQSQSPVPSGTANEGEVRPEESVGQQAADAHYEEFKNLVGDGDLSKRTDAELQRIIELGEEFTDPYALRDMEETGTGEFANQGVEEQVASVVNAMEVAREILDARNQAIAQEPLWRHDLGNTLTHDEKLSLIDEISQGSTPVILVSFRNIRPVLEKLGVKESTIQYIESEVSIPGCTTKGFFYVGYAFLNDDRLKTGTSIVGTYVHERQHGFTRNDAGLLKSIVDNSDINELASAVESICGTDFYTKEYVIKHKDHDAMADEFISHVMEQVYTQDKSVADVCVENGFTNPKIIDILNTLDNEQRQSDTLAKSRRSSILNRGAQDSSGQDGRNNAQGEEQGLPQQPSGSSQDGNSGTPEGGQTAERGVTPFAETERGKIISGFKEKHPGNYGLLFRNGANYDIYGEDAIKAGEILGLKTRERDGVPFLSFPTEDIGKNLRSLIAGGLKIGIASDPNHKPSKGDYQVGDKFTWDGKEAVIKDLTYFGTAIVEVDGARREVSREQLDDILDYGDYMYHVGEVVTYNGKRAQIVEFASGDPVIQVEGENEKRYVSFSDIERIKKGQEQTKRQGRDAAEIEIGGALVDRLGDMGLNVSTDLQANRAALKAAKADKSEAGAIHYYKTPSGQQYGFSYKGKVYLDPTKINAELPLHEYGHLWAEALRRLNPENWQHVVDTIKTDKDAWEFVKSLRPELTDENEIAEEVIATFSGKKGAEKMRAEYERMHGKDADYKSKWGNISKNISKAIQDFWKAVGDFLNIKYESAEQVYDQVLKDFVDNMNPWKRVSDFLRQRDAEYVQAAESGDIKTATNIFYEALKENIGNGITPYMSVGTYNNLKRLAKGVKTRDAALIKEAADLIAPLIPDNAVLIPAPSHSGTATDMLDLAKAIAEVTGSEVADVLRSAPRESQYQAKKTTGVPMASKQLGIAVEGEIPADKTPIIIDNVVDSGNTAEACVQAVGKGVVVTLADSAEQYSHAASLKSAAPVLRDKDGKVIPLSKRFDLSGSRYLGRRMYLRPDDLRLSVSGTQTIPVGKNTLVGLHNISAEKLRKALKMGGLANPSTAVIDIARQNHEQYGDISLIMPSAMVDSYTGRNAGTFTSDIWSPTYPSVERIMSDKGDEAYYQAITKAFGDNEARRPILSRAKLDFDDYLDRDNVRAGLTYWYLLEKGIEPTDIYYNSGVPEEVKERFKPLAGYLSNLNKEEIDQLIAIIADEKGTTVEQVKQDAQEAVKRYRETIDNPDEKPFRKNIAQKAIDEIEYYGIPYGILSNEFHRLNNAVQHDGTIDLDATLIAAQDLVQGQYQADFDKWLADMDKRFDIKEVIFTDYNNEGDRKYIPHTLANASKKMNSERLQNAGSNGGLGATRGQLVEKMLSLAEIRANKNRLRPGEEEDHETEEWNKLGDEWFEKILGPLSDMQKISDNPFSNTGYAEQRLQEALFKADPVAYLNKEYGYKIGENSEWAKNLKDLVQRIKSLPTKYFETKFRRPVYLNEFAAAVVPNDLSQDLRDGLQNSGLTLFDYDPSTAGSRRDATLKATEADGIRFSISGKSKWNTTPAAEREMTDIKDRAIKDGTFMQAPNGKPSRLNERQWLQVRTENFKRWFGDWQNDPQNASKILDENGEPRVVFHGTYYAGFTEFGRKPSGIYFADFDTSTWYTEEGARVIHEFDDDMSVSGIYACFLNIRNPKRYNYEGHGALDGFRGKKEPSVYYEQMMQQQYGKKPKYDGMVCENIKDFGGYMGGLAELDEDGRLTRYYDNSIYIASEPNQIKSATDNDGSFSNESDDIRFSISNENNDIFYSNAERAVEQIKQEKATPEQWKAMIEKNGGLKAGEDKWIGLSDWLKAQKPADTKKREGESMLDYIDRVNDAYKKFTISKQQVLDYIRANKIQIEEQEYSNGLSAAAQEKLEEFNAEFQDLMAQADAMENSSLYLSDDAEWAYNEMKNSYGDDFEMAFEWQEEDGEYKLVPKEDWYNGGISDAALYYLGDGSKPINDTRLEYTTKGLENKREIALTVPTIESWNENDDIHFGDAGEGRAIAWVRFGDATDEQGNKTLVIDEIQSKRHQEGRDKGYYDGASSKELMRQMDSAEKAYTDYLEGLREKYGVDRKPELFGKLNEEEVAEADRLNEAANNARRAWFASSKDAVPAAPFEKNWHELAMKRILRFAAENGYDKVAWTTGEQQAARYDLGKQLEAISVFYNDETGLYDVHVTDKGYDPMDDSYTLEEGLDDEGLKRTIGKDLYNRVMEQGKQYGWDGGVELTGDDLVIGTDGMRGFYDDMLPRFMQKYGKKWGVQVGEVTMPDLEEGYQTMHSIDITPEMRESVLQGQPMFSVTGSRGAANIDKMEGVTTRMDNLAAARQMEEDGKDAKTIRMATGWERGADGKWRYEIDDVQLNADNVKANFRKLDRRGVTAPMVWYHNKFTDIIADSPERKQLLAAYPQLADLDIEFYDYPNKERGAYSSEKKKISVNRANVRSVDECRSVLLHEIQHAIQEAELFAKGTSKEQIQLTWKLNNEVHNKVDEYFDKMGFKEWLTSHNGDKAFVDRLMQVIHMFPNRDFNIHYLFVETLPRDKQMEAIDVLGDANDVIRENRDAIYGINRRGDTMNADELYHNAAGEVESRNVQNRMNLTQEERRERLLAETEDVAREDQVVIMNAFDMANSANEEDQTTTDKFKAWFGDWQNDPEHASKVVDADGKPLVVEHSTPNEFTSFDINKLGENSGDRGIFGAGFYFGDRGNTDIYGKNHMQVYLNMRKPFVMEDYMPDDISALIVEHFNTPALRKIVLNENGKSITVGEYIDIVNAVNAEMEEGKHDAEIERISSFYRPDSARRKVRDDAIADKSFLIPGSLNYLISTMIGSQEFTNALRDNGNDGVIVGKGNGYNEYVVFSPNQIKSATNNSGEFSKDNNDIRFSVNNPSTLSRSETVTKALVQQANNNYNIMQSALKKVTADLKGIRAAMRMQSDYDRKVVDSLLNLYNTLLQENGVWAQYMPDTTRRIATQIVHAIGKQNITEEVNTIMDHMVHAQAKAAQRQWDKLRQTPIDKINISGVVMQGKVALEGQHALKAMNDALQANMTIEQIEEQINQLMDMEDNATDESLKTQYKGQWIGLTIAAQHLERLQHLQEERQQLDLELQSARSNKALKPAARQQLVENIKQAMRDNYIEQAEAYTRSTQDLSEYVNTQEGRAKDFIRRQDANRDKIRSYAQRDLEGLATNPNRNRTKGNVARSIWDAFASPIRDLQSLLRLTGLHAPDGEGYLYNHFMRGWMDGADKERTGIVAASKTLDEKIAELTHGKYKTWEEAARKINDASHNKFSVMSSNGVDGKDQPVIEEIPLNAGNALYIYAVNKQIDGKMKLSSHNITDEDVKALVDAVREQFGQEIIDVVDWVQSEFFSQLRNRYNPTHEALFGAPMDAIENYFPLRLNPLERQQNEDLSEPDTDAARLLAGTSTGSIKRRKRNSIGIDICNADFFQEVIRHISQMERWNAFAQWNRDANILFSDTNFRNRIKGMKGTIYGEGDKLYNYMKDAFRVAIGTYKTKTDPFSEITLNMAKGVTSAKINFRIFTALKQIASFPAFFTYMQDGVFVGSYLRNWLKPHETMKWAKENLPNFEKRVSKRDMGDMRLMQRSTDWQWNKRILEWSSKYGMFFNVFFDTLTCATGARAVYDSHLADYLKKGYSEEDARNYARQDAEQAFNTSQQSSEGAFMSAVQQDRNLVTAALTVFRTSPIQYTRNFFYHTRNLLRKFGEGKRDEQIAFRMGQYKNDGLNDEQARKAAEKDYNKSLRQDIVGFVVYGALLNILWRLAGQIPYLLLGDDDDKKKKILEDATTGGALVSPFTGLIGGSYIESALDGNGLITSLFAPELPFTQDAKRAEQYLQNNKYAEFTSQALSVAMQSLTGFDPLTASDMISRIVTTLDSEEELDAATQALRVSQALLSIPQSQYEQMLIDKVVSGETDEDAALEDYIRYQKIHTAPLTWWLRGEESDEKAEENAEERFNKLLTDRDKIKNPEDYEE